VHGCTECISSNPATRETRSAVVEAQTTSGGKRCFELDALFGKSSTQDEVYDQSGAKEAVCESIFGYNCTILSYGQTGSGKSFTMGSAVAVAPSLELDEHAGIIPRACWDLFQQIDEKCDGDTEVKLSYLEIYNETLRDLLSSDSYDEHLRIRETLHGQVYVSGLSSHTVTSPQEVVMLMKEASSRRVVASTSLNECSSRSHAICVLRVTGLAETGDGGTEKFSSNLTFVDLAGSERMRKTGNHADRLKEGIHINKSLFALGQVMSALAEQRKPPYRDSKLTRLLADSLGGNSRTILVACVSPASANIEESLNTLRYAMSARNIKNSVTRNIEQSLTSEESARSHQRKELKLQLQTAQTENERLREQVQVLQESLQRERQLRKMQADDASKQLSLLQLWSDLPVAREGALFPRAKGGLLSCLFPWLGGANEAE